MSYEGGGEGRVSRYELDALGHPMLKMLITREFEAFRDG